MLISAGKGYVITRVTESTSLYFFSVSSTHCKSKEKSKDMQEYNEFFQQNTMLCVAWIAIFGAVVYTLFKSSTAKFKFIGVNELTQKVNKENGVVIDIRSKDDFAKGHITDSIHVLPSDIKSNNLGSIASRKADPVIVVCRTGQTAQASANELAKAGFEQVSVLTHGVGAWNDAKLPLIRGKK